MKYVGALVSRSKQVRLWRNLDSSIDTYVLGESKDKLTPSSSLVKRGGINESFWKEGVGEEPFSKKVFPHKIYF